MLFRSPGETEVEFDNLVEFVREAEFDRVGVFTYSVEDGTHSATLEGRVQKRTMERRRKDLMRVQRQISKKKMKAMVGRTIDVLVEGPSEESEFLLEGRHEGQAPEIDGQVYLALGENGGKPPRQGDLVRARVTGFADYDVAATVEEVIVPTRMKRVARLPVLSA